VTFPLLPPAKLALDVATPEGCKAELTYCWLHTEMVYPPRKRSPIQVYTNGARAGLTSFMRRTPLTTTPRLQRNNKRRKRVTVILAYPNYTPRARMLDKKLCCRRRTARRAVSNKVYNKKLQCQNRIDSSSRFDTIPACDGRTDRHANTWRQHTALA